MMRLAIPALVLILATSAASAETVSGSARVVDGDTLAFGAVKVRILDIDAPESRQLCDGQAGAQWRCGQAATAALVAFIGEQAVTCAGDARDRYRRLLARCVVLGTDLAEWMASAGWAVPYRECSCVVIRAAADRAKSSGRGIWSGSFAMPWDWRKAH